ncbi:hypothetical protein JXB28_01945 [Candidatus Woesearchaeota archaeon]|nr:hypothetical protein [Candidatus Woesearchaeota archaeon]
MEETIPNTQDSSNMQEAPQAAAPSTGDVSNKTIVVLVVLTVIISILGTLVVFGEIEGVMNQPQPAAAKSLGATRPGAQVTLTIKENPKPVQGTGLVTLEILPS